MKVAAQAKTCTEDGWNAYEYCSVCGDAEAAKQAALIPASHEIVKVAAQAKTCTEAGWNAYEYCSACDYTTYVEIPASHELEDGEAKDVTCTEDGWNAYEFCTECDYTTKQVIPAFHQKEVAITEAVPSTCKVRGYAVGSVKCETCGEWIEEKCHRLELAACSFTVETDRKEASCTEDGYIVKACVYECGATDTTIIPALGHEWEREGAAEGWTLTKAPSCYEVGVETRTCSCGYSENRDVAMVAHTYNEGEAVKGIAKWNEETKQWETCTEEDTILYTCSVCPATAENHAKTEAAKIAGHAWEYEAADPATCMNPGVASSQTCTRCGEEQGGGEIPALGHLWGERYDVQDATCLVDGHYSQQCEREGCDAVNAPAVQTVTIKAKGEHTWGDWTVKTAATCAAKGTEERACTLCDEGYETREIELAKHEYVAVVTEPTCQAEGYTTYTCKNCPEGTEGHAYVDNWTAMLDHVPEVVQAVAPICGTAGATMGTKCSACGEWINEPEVVAALEHKYNEGVITTEPDCVETGVKLLTCTQPGCNAEIEGHTKEVVVEALGHKSEDVPAVDVTCTEDGCTAGTKCSVCGEILTGCEVIEHQGHQEETIPAVEVSCTVDGYSAGVKCAVCDTVLEAPVLTEKAHHLELIQVEAQAPKCEQIGWDAYEYCTKCDYTTYVEKAALEHKKVTVDGYAETCTVDGLTDGIQCELCQKWFVKQEVIAAAHKPVDVDEIKVTCTTDGYTAGKKCSVCETVLEGCEVIEHQGHQEETLAAKDATCTATGLKEGKKCTVCGTVTVEQEIVAKLSHNHTKLPAVAPTCEVDGLTEGDWCEMCGHYWIEQKNDPATGHNIVIDEAVEATCTAPGWTKGEHCTNCNDKTIAQEVVPMKAHTEVEIPAVAATCLVDGKTAGKKCSVCGTVTEEPEVVTAPGHKPVEIPAEAPSCTEDGKTAGEKCSVCGLVLKAQSVDPAPGHKEETIPAVDATCTLPGSTAGVKCSVCNTVLSKPADIQAQGHKNVTVEGYAATCTVDGLSDGVRCEVCQTWTTKQQVITAEGHKPVKVPGKAPTCLETGLTDGSACSVCKTELQKQDSIPAINHANKAPGTAKDATCTVAGNTAGVYCPDCKTWLEVQQEIPATNHANKAPGEAKPATCTEAGNTAGVYCPDCKTWLEDQKTINPTGHTEVIDKAVAATCTTVGKTEGKHCGKCPEILVQQEEIPAINHANKAPGEAKAPTCTVAGNTAGVYCPDCMTWLEEQQEIPATNHANKAPGEAKDPTCTEAGNTAGMYCPDCETWLEPQSEIAATGHQMDEGKVTTDFTCTTAGVKTYTCLNGCGHTTTEELPAMHIPQVVPAVAPTCTESGLTEGSECSVCHEVLVEQEIIEASHTWEVVKIHTEATCTTDGVMEVVCSVEGCGETEMQVIPATGHTEVIDPAKAATCEADGCTAGKHCSTCGEILVAQKVIAGGHRWSKAPCTEIGATCSRCKETNTELLEHAMTEATCTADSVCKYGCGLVGEKAPGHTIVEIEEIPAMCGEPGWTAGSMCSVCGVTIEEPKIIPALEHNIVQYEAKRPTFTSIGWEAYEACSYCTYTTQVAIPALGEQTISSYSEFMKYLPYLEEFAVEYAKMNPGTDPVALIIKYIRTGVDRYNSGSWGIMAGYEDAGFAKYVGQQEDILNAEFENIEDMIKVSGLKNLTEFNLPNGQRTDIGHMFGTMDITYHNNGSVNHADVGGWAGDLVDLLSTADHKDHVDVIASAEGDFEKLVDAIRYELLGHSFNHGDTFSKTDIYGDLDAFYVMQNLDADEYAAGDMTALFNSYFTTSLSDVDRAAYLMEKRLNGVATRSAVRDAVYTAYTSNNVISTLEGTRDFNNTDLTELRQAVCYAFADYLCALAGDYVDVTDNPYLTVFQSEHANLAPGISMEIHYANSADGKQMVYYLAYGAVGRDDVTVLANYNERHVTHWEMSRVLDQANSTQELYSNPENKDTFAEGELSKNEAELFQENFNVITAINGAGFNMGTGEPGGLLIMHGQEYHAVDGNGFFGMHKDGYAVIGTTEEYNTKYKGQIEEAIAGFGTMLVKDGKIAITAETDYYSNRASRTAIGITATGRVVFMVLDGRQEPWSCGGSMIEIAQIMKNAGCVQAINLDGGGSTTFVARQAGDDELSVVNRPSDGVSRSVSTGLVMISTAPSSTKFDHAVLESNYNFATVGATVQMSAKGVSATGNVVDLPEGAAWAVSDEEIGSIDENGVFTAKALGSVEVRLVLDGTTLGYKTLNVVQPDQIYFTKEKIDSVYGSSVELPLKVRYQGKDVAFVAEDIVFTLSTTDAGVMDGLSFVAAEESKITTVNVTAALKENEATTASIDVILFKQGENSFDFGQATGGSRILAWQRTVSNSYTADNSVYYVVNPDEKMVTSYAIALDMSQIPIPKRLEDLTYMLPGSDLEGACAWTFLLQLAERISVLTTVSPKITFDPNFDVDYSEIKLINDYFTLDAVDFDEKTNTLTMTLHWIDQTAAIPVETANPLCMVTGLKVTPKDDAAWNDKDQLKPIHSGDVSYRIYMRASGLYSFAQKPENQEVFGLKPFVNPNLESEKGGYFEDTYTTFTDTYTLVRTLKNGWYTEESGFRYYVNGVYLTGVQKADGLFYDFGENGINVGKKTYTGLHWMDGKQYYIQVGEIATGWNIIGNDWYLFDYVTGAGIEGKRVSGGIEYEFEHGRLLHGVWVKDSVGYKYFYGPGNYYSGWKVIDGEEYFFVKNYALTGIVPVQEAHDLIHYWYEFTDEGKKVGLAKDGLYWYNGERYYVVDGLADRLGLYYIDGHYYNFTYNDYATRNQTFWVYVTNDTGMAEGMYRFDNDGKMIMTTEIVKEDGVLYYYENGPRVDQKGMVEFKDNLYYIAGGGAAVVDKLYWVSKTNNLVSKTGMYLFDENGCLVRDTLIYKGTDGKLNYIKDGCLTYSAGLVYVGGAYYYIQSDGTAVTDTEMYISKTNGLMKAGTYAFDADGKMIIRLAGDAAGDYDVDLDDVLALWAYLAGEDVKINLKNADVNADGKVDANDALLIMQYVSGWDVTLK